MHGTKDEGWHIDWTVPSILTGQDVFLLGSGAGGRQHVYKVNNLVSRTPSKVNTWLSGLRRRWIGLLTVVGDIILFHSIACAGYI